MNKILNILSGMSGGCLTWSIGLAINGHWQIAYGFLSAFCVLLVTVLIANNAYLCYKIDKIDEKRDNDAK